jgi:hypothetical protein
MRECVLCGYCVGVYVCVVWLFMVKCSDPSFSQSRLGGHVCAFLPLTSSSDPSPIAGIVIVNGGGGGLMESSARGALSVKDGKAHLVTLKGLTLDRPLHHEVFSPSFSFMFLTCFFLSCFLTSFVSWFFAGATGGVVHGHASAQERIVPSGRLLHRAPGYPLLSFSHDAHSFVAVSARRPMHSLLFDPHFFFFPLKAAWVRSRKSLR